MPKPIVLTRHAQDVMIERGLDRGMVDMAARNPEWTLADPISAGVERRFRTVPGSRRARASRRML